MREISTRGDICLKDDYNLTYKVAEIIYTEREDGNFVYVIRPNYSVMDLIEPDIFQGIPGLDLDLKKELYIRENIVPVFISERTPGENREDLQKLLSDCNMKYLNRLEWLIETETCYSGDRLFVQRNEDKSIKIDSINSIGNRSAIICRRLLEVICYGNTVITPQLTINDKNRAQYYELLMSLYRTERRYLDSRRKEGISISARKGNYKGRERIRLDKLETQEIFLDYMANKKTSSEAARQLGISKSTFLRRFREYELKELNQKNR